MNNFVGGKSSLGVRATYICIFVLDVVHPINKRTGRVT